ncbi:hypothetical protein [Roseibium aestuarii]|uniref:EF-hand domain-containing protein n=1 Tax=Roseibium aestuarii TaxID=2600299 RepID=A0ABW4JT78_9HYPH|nr:hypothetical protein [Roseibium aestuarii]
MRMPTLILIAGLVAPFAAVSAAQAAPGAHFIENWDLDGDGAVTVDEARDRRSDVFASFDTNDDGFLDAEEYVTFDEARANDQAENGQGMGEGRRNPANGLRLEVNDLDGDGRVSRGEFLDAAAGWIARIDRNGDGVVRADDFGRP